MSATWRRAAVATVALLVGPAATVSCAPPASVAPVEPEPITVTPLLGPDGQPLREVLSINEQGHVRARMTIQSGPGYDGVIWQDGTTTRIAPEGLWADIADLSDRGQAVGSFASMGSSVGDPSRPFSWFDGEWTPLTPEDTPGEAVAVNEDGQVLGSRQTPAGATETVVWDEGDVTVAPPGVQAGRAINDRGQALVAVDVGEQTHAGVWQVGGDVTTLSPLPGDTYSRADDINEQGHVVGVSGTDVAGEHAVLWRDGEAVDLGTLGLDPSHATDINDQDQVVGTSTTPSGEEHAFLWEDGTLVDLGTLGGYGATASAINDHGQVVGFSSTVSGYWPRHAFLWEDGEMVDLGALIEGPVEEGSSASDINDRGQIVGTTDAGPVLWTLPQGAGT